MMVNVVRELHSARTKLENELNAVNLALDALNGQERQHPHHKWDAERRAAQATRMRKLWKTKGAKAFNK